MSQNRRAFIPVILVTLISVLLIAYFFYTTSNAPRPHQGIHPPNGSHGMPHPDGKKGFDFTLFGNIAIACGAISYWWFLFKKKLASPSKPLKKVAKRLYSIHTYTGWAALVFIIIHGGYYLITDFHNSKIFTGLAAFLLLLALALYGWLYKRVRNKFMRTSHFILGHIWLVALLIHTGGFFIFMVIVTLALWLIVRWVDLSAKKTVSH
ncbi:hypothetical protein PP175_02525 [Aneurinibacillus sp. Ricciae_BoGa-3]|uniref:hypothetical protein n=1 Tax=Aneurinibacillus sp. Ricciae_BoGa-3 TaxID=3022697 RepID=UPI00233FD647|nr:hypothetical protein [Aneurinibacillus sp. Ricciae_BoGa-3]WCK54909.1 hypothetical protein PP175_02525 [Aneurinibacillus sp. Ricciae_BoGa-3]